MSRNCWPPDHPGLGFRRHARAGACALSLLGLGLAEPGASRAASKTPYGVFPRPFEIFRKLMADPREIQLSASYYRLNGMDASDVALGHGWGLARWYGKDNVWAWQWSIEAMAYSRFRLTGAVNEFQTVDFFANLPLEIRRGAFSGKFMIFHQSSHLGDDYIRRTNDLGFRYSVDGLKALTSVEPGELLRLYGGGTYLLHSIPSPKRGGLQAGFELTSNDLGWLANYPTRVYLAQDLQPRENIQWNVNSRSVLGLRIGFKKETRFMRVHIGYFTGHSPYGQFFTQREHYADLGISFDL